MDRTTKQRMTQAGGWSTVGGAVAVATGATPIGVAIGAGLGGALGWQAVRRAQSRSR
jgi:hypothetical protein